MAKQNMQNSDDFAACTSAMKQCTLKKGGGLEFAFCVGQHMQDQDQHLSEQCMNRVHEKVHQVNHHRYRRRNIKHWNRPLDL